MTQWTVSTRQTETWGGGRIDVTAEVNVLNAAEVPHDPTSNRNIKRYSTTLQKQFKQ